MAAAPPEALRLAELTTVEVGDRLARGPLDVVVPLGACEQHGPHLPLATDQLIAEALAERAADRVGGCLVAPSVPVGSSSHHLSFAGTVSVPDEVLAAQQAEMARSLLAHGFRAVYIVTGHAGNAGSMVSAADRVGERVVSFADWPAQRDAIHAVARDRLGLDPEVVGTHAGHFETSILLAIRPDLVRVERYERGYVGAAREAGARLRSEGMAAVSPNGVIGDPEGADAEAGVLYLEALVQHVVDGIGHHRAARAEVTTT